MIKLIRKNPFSNQTRRIPTKRNLNQVSSTFRSINSPGGGTIDTRKHRKPAMPEQAPRPVRLIQSYEIMKFRIFTNLNKKRKRPIPKKVTIIVRSPTEPTRNRLTTNTTKKKTIPDTTYHNGTKQCLISFTNMRRISGAAKNHGCPKEAHLEKPFRPQRSAVTLLRQASRRAALKC